MALFNVQANGNAPAGLSPGDLVNTAGGVYKITSPGAIGASYNPDSGYWSVETGSIPSMLSDVSEYANTSAKENSLLSQQFAKEQMAFQREMSSKAMSFSAEQARINRDFQKMMSDSSYQRVVKDLISAGLNPVLGVSNGASTPSGSSAAGVSGSGASGNVDISNNSFLAQALGSLLNQQTQLKTSQLAAKTQLETANISAKTARDVANINNAWQEYFYQNYPQGMFGGISAIVQGITDLVTGTPSGSKPFGAVQGSDLFNNPDFFKGVLSFISNPASFAAKMGSKAVKSVVKYLESIGFDYTKAMK